MTERSFKLNEPEQSNGEQQPLSFYDPVQILVNSIAMEISMEAANQSGGFDFWGQINTHFFETSIASFNESLETLKNALAQNKELYDYAVRFLIRTKSNPFADEAIATVMISFSELNNALDLNTLVGLDPSKADSFSKLILFIAINKPQLSLLILNGVLKGK